MCKCYGVLDQGEIGNNRGFFTQKPSGAIQENGRHTKHKARANSFSKKF